jgi:hypothetical protein
MTGMVGAGMGGCFIQYFAMDLIMMFVGFCAFVLWIIHGVK